MIASLSHLEALCLNVTLNALNSCLLLKKKKKRTLVLINNDTFQREPLSERPIRQPLIVCEICSLCIYIHYKYLYRLCQKKYCTIWFHIFKIIVELLFITIYGVESPLLNLQILNFVLFKFDIYMLRYRHLSEPINFLHGPVNHKAIKIPLSEVHWWNRTTDKQGKCEVNEHVLTTGLGWSGVTKMYYLRPVSKHRPKSEGLEEASMCGCSTTSAKICLRSTCV